MSDWGSYGPQEDGMNALPFAEEHYRTSQVHRAPAWVARYGEQGADAHDEPHDQTCADASPLDGPPATSGQHPSPHMSGPFMPPFLAVDQEYTAQLYYGVESSARQHGASPPASVPLTRQATTQASHQMSNKRANEVSLGERLQLDDEFKRRKSAGETISMAKFEKEKGLLPGRYKQWHAQLEKQRKTGVPLTDSTKKRIRPPKYPQIEDDMRQWLGGHDPTNVRTKDIREQAMKIATQLGVEDFSASDRWIAAFRKRWQPPVPPSESSAATAAAAAASGTDSIDALTGQEVDESAAALEADRFIGPIIDSNRQNTTCSPDDGADQLSQTSEQNTMSEPTSESQLTYERPPAEIHNEECNHREGPPSELLSVSSAESVGSTQEDDGIALHRPASPLRRPSTSIAQSRRNRAAAAATAQAKTKRVKAGQMLSFGNVLITAFSVFGILTWIRILLCISALPSRGLVDGGVGGELSLQRQALQASQQSLEQERKNLTDILASISDLQQSLKRLRLMLIKCISLAIQLDALDQMPSYASGIYSKWPNKGPIFV
ncbi:unnamed protein product [Vitrella brassicaformis CCMP3155]|uniref:HTH CENPB-type domain-containing protein n=1 Tax=Vitrella brassicaformis (strain CCMP3155) TaxID=1169540 RepID=A0A0G4GF75_VITBC|nr:unnamed protein product [Vitrella brassicaformis CCMP3155]|eukprot:CEM28176.1 unnamed protein product [Vitrella brassicaformis CCMP3155]